MNTISKKELTALVRQARDYQQGYVDARKDSANPCVIELSVLAQGRADALNAVLFALERNERYSLRVFASGHIGVKGD